MIPLNQSDWTNNGDRTSWCTKQVWWTNQNISLVGSSLGPTEVKVGETVTIAVGIQGVVGTEGDTEMAIIQNVQAWACYPSPTAGKTSAALLLPSLASSNPAFAGAQPVFGSNPVFNPGDYQNSLGGFFSLISLSGTWTPTAEDLVAPNTDTHCCLLATTAGLAQAESKVGGGFTGNPVGTVVPSDINLASLIDICSSPYQGQSNIAIVPLVKHKRIGHEFGFVAAGLNSAPAEVVLDVTQVKQRDQVDPAVLRALRGGPYRALNLTPASSGVTGLRLAKNTHKFTASLSKIIRPAEKIVESGSSLRLSLPSEGIQPLLLQVELDPTLAPGSVHVFDITQTDATGKRGGIRVGAIVVP
jgi:hypothetical protein